jgi:hypothetical protein
MMEKRSLEFAGISYHQRRSERPCAPFKPGLLPVRLIFVSPTEEQNDIIVIDKFILYTCPHYPSLRSNLRQLTGIIEFALRRMMNYIG